MLIYEYRCCDCETTFETLVRGSDTVTCPYCGSSSLIKLLSAPSYQAGKQPGRQDVPAAVGKNGVTRRLTPRGTCVDLDD